MEEGKSFADSFEKVINDILLRPVEPYVVENKKVEKHKMPVDFANGHFAGASKNNGETLTKKLKRFNSPFWPFQFISTSIGNEGFDFHTYCRKVVHWSLEYNPVKFEQREGRINRYQGYANRLNFYDFLEKNNLCTDTQDPDKVWRWSEKYDMIRESTDSRIRKMVKESKGLFPDFVMEMGEKYPLERECYYYPYSFESHEFEKVLKTVGYYRALLGQPATDGDDGKFEELFRKFKETNRIDDASLHEYFINLYPYPKADQKEV